VSLKRELKARLRAAVRQFWTTREAQARKQRSVSGAKDAGARSAVTGGAQMNGFVNLVRDLLCDSGLPKPQVYCDKCVEIPGWY
jgi:Restriction endonuclease XhoI